MEEGGKRMVQNSCFHVNEFINFLNSEAKYRLFNRLTTVIF